MENDRNVFELWRPADDKRDAYDVERLDEEEMTELMCKSALEGMHGGCDKHLPDVVVALTAQVKSRGSSTCRAGSSSDGAARLTPGPQPVVLQDAPRARLLPNSVSAQR